MNKSKNIYPNIAVANLYSESTFNSPVLSQAVLWEKLYILEEKESFYQVVCEDGYRGWIHKTQVSAAQEQKTDKTLLLTRSFIYFYQQPDIQSAVVRSAVAGSRIAIKEEKGKWFRTVFPDGMSGWIEQDAFSALPHLSRDTIIRFSKRFLGTPYYWGGKTPLGFDCSGFVQFVHKMSGIQIRRDAFMQFDDAKFVSKDYSDAGKGDLCFFSENGNKITHVGLYIGKGKVVHVRGMVKINSLLNTDADFDADLFATFVEVKSFL